MDDLSDEVGSRTLSVNLAGLRLPIMLKSLARSINMQVYMSPAVNAAPQSQLGIFREPMRSIFLISRSIITALRWPTTEKWVWQGSYTRAEFSERVDDAVAAAELHNRRARNFA